MKKSLFIAWGSFRNDWWRCSQWAKSSRTQSLHQSDGRQTPGEPVCWGELNIRYAGKVIKAIIVYNIMRAKMVSGGKYAILLIVKEKKVSELTWVYLISGFLIAGGKDAMFNPTGINCYQRQGQTRELNKF